MMKQEFEKLAGYEVSEEDYNTIIEPMYLATKMSKQDFVKCLDKKRFALRTKKQIILEMKKLADHLQETCEHYSDNTAKQRLDDLLEELTDRFYSGFYTFFVTETYFPEHRGCSFPSAVEVYGGSKYGEKFIEEIIISTPWYEM